METRTKPHPFTAKLALIIFAALTATLLNAAAARAYEAWNWGEILFPMIGPGAGSGRNFCNRVGVNSVRSLDINQDGFTDSPPFMATDAFVLKPTIPEVMLPMIKLYSVAFWKTFLEGDHRYQRYLTPGSPNATNWRPPSSSSTNDRRESHRADIQDTGRRHPGARSARRSGCLS